MVPSSFQSFSRRATAAHPRRRQAFQVILHLALSCTAVAGIEAQINAVQTIQASVWMHLRVTRRIVVYAFKGALQPVT